MIKSHLRLRIPFKKNSIYHVLKIFLSSWLNDEEGIIMNKEFVIEHNFKEHNFKQQNTPFFTSEKF